MAEIDRETVRQIIRSELPALLREDRALRLEMAELLADVLMTRRDHEASIAELGQTLAQLNATLREEPAQKRAQEEGIEWYAAPDEVPVEDGDASPEGQEPGGKG